MQQKRPVIDSELLRFDVEALAVTRPTREVGHPGIEVAALTVVGPFVVAFVDNLAVVVSNNDPAVGCDLGIAVDVLPELVVDALGGDPVGDRPLTGGEADTADMLTSGRSVLVIGTGAAAFAAVDAVLAASVFANDGVHVAALREHGHALGECANVSVG